MIGEKEYIAPIGFSTVSNKGYFIWNVSIWIQPQLNKPLEDK